MSIVAEVIRALPDLWRYPQLASIIGQVEQPDPRTLVPKLLADIANPGSRRQVFLNLLANGEIDQAKSLLDNPGFLFLFEGDDETVSGFYRAYDETKSREIEAAQCRIAALKTRSIRVGLSDEVPTEILESAAHSRSETEVWFDAWESSIEAKEGQIADEIRNVPSYASSQRSDDISVRQWRECVERCIKHREFDTARFLVDNGPTAQAEQLPATVPQLSGWPYRMHKHTLRSIIQWYCNEDAAPAGFGSWVSDTADQDAAEMIKMLRQFSEADQPEAELAKEFAIRLDRFVGMEEPPPRTTNAVAGGFETRLFGLYDPKRPCCGIGPDGIPFRVTTASLNEDEPDCQLAIAVVLSGSVVPVRISVLLQLLRPGSHRRISLLRDIGRHQSILTAQHYDLGRLTIPDQTEARRVWLNWLLDIAALQVNDQSVFALIEYYAGKPASLLPLFLSTLLQMRRGSTLEYDDLNVAWQSEGFRSAARERLLRKLDHEPISRAILAIVVELILDPHDAIQSDEIFDYLPDFGVENATKHQSTEALHYLVEQSLLELEKPGEYRLPATGTRFLLLEAISDTLAFARDGLDAGSEN